MAWFLNPSTGEPDNHSGQQPAGESTVAQTDPGVRGDTVSNVTKNAELVGGATVQVPMFVNEGDKVKIDTRTRDYMGRA